MSPRTRHFVRHYLEMVAAMFIGMAVLGVPFGWALGAVGSSWSALSPALMLLSMAITMTVPMVGWMRYRGHGWRANAEMAAAMLLPAFATMAMVAGGLGSLGLLMVLEHVAMLLAMLGAMLARPGEYTCAHAQVAA